MSDGDRRNHKQRPRRFAGHPIVDDSGRRLRGVKIQCLRSSITRSVAPMWHPRVMDRLEIGSAG